MADITDTDRELIEELRQASKHLLTPDFDTDYNILRFIQGWKYDKDAALDNLQRHLKNRKVFEIDKIHEMEDNEIIKEHFPSGLLGTTGKDNKLVVIETTGRTDVAGISKSIEGTEFFHYRIKYMERILKAMNEQERLTQKQSGVIYIFDLEGVSMDPFLITTLTGSYRILWANTMLNYPEWIHISLVINVPTFFNILWKTFGPLLPERTRMKTKFLTGDWRKELLEHVDPEYLPVHWGGTMVDENGDPMCRSKIVVPHEKIPERLYWKNVEKYQLLPDDQVERETIKAGSYFVRSFWVSEAGTILQYYHESSTDFTFVIYYSEDKEEKDLEKMEEIFPFLEVAGGLAPDRYRVVFEHPGAYHIKIGNEKAWFFSLTCKYQWQFVKADGSPASVEELQADPA